ncbi:MAG TPA: ABC transporter permease [Actinomycetota bacterium]|nr:ABC transporter permease [Actinomycetota bacterium]
MGAIRLRLGAELRTRWRGWLGLALLLAAFAGLTFATAAGARRTDTAYQRLLKISHPFDQFLLGVGPVGQSLFPGNNPITLEQLRAIPEVRDFVTVYFFSGPTSDAGIATPDLRFDHSFNRAKVISGRLPDATRADEVAVPVAVAQERHARVGGTLSIQLVDQSSTQPKTVTIKVLVTAIIAEPGEFPPFSDIGPPDIHFTPAFFAKYKSFGPFPYTLVRLKRGPADLPSFMRAIAAVSNGPVIGYRHEDQARNVERSFHLQAVALELFAICLAIVAALVLGQTLGRQTMSEGVDYPALRALGMTRKQLFGLGLLRAAIVSAAGIVLAIPIAIAASPLLPTGLARAADPDPGLHFDVVAIGGGALLAFIVLMILVLIPAIRAARLAETDEGLGRAEPGVERASRSVEAVTRAGASAPAVVGMRLALEPGRGRTAVPVRTTIAGVVLAVTALTITLTFGASLRYLLDTPRLYGLTWDADVGADSVTEQQAKAAFAAARSDPDVSALGIVSLGAPLLVDGVPADAMVVQGGNDRFLPPIESGRAPQGQDEIALGPKTLRRIHKSVGDEVDVSMVGLKGLPYRVVGKMVLPTVGHTANLGEGSIVTQGGLTRLFKFGPDFVDEFVVRFKPGVNVVKARARLDALVQPHDMGVAAPATPGDLLNFGRSRNLPFILAGLLALLGLGTLAHALVTSINRRRRDFAICKTLGFTRGDVARAIAWQSSTFIVVSLAFGILAGVIAGRLLWNAYANQLGILAVPRVPAWTLALLVPAALLLANGLAVWPARSAARTRPAVVLRTE